METDGICEIYQEIGALVHPASHVQACSCYQLSASASGQRMVVYISYRFLSQLDIFLLFVLNLSLCRILMVIMALVSNFVRDSQRISYLIDDLKMMSPPLALLIVYGHKLTIAANPILVVIIHSLTKQLVVWIKVQILNQCIAVYNLTTAGASFPGIGFIYYD